jgi:hypothetical protein
MRCRGYVLAFAAILAIPAGCGGSAGQTMTPSQAPAQSIASNLRRDLLYVAHARSYSAKQTAVSILTFPQGRPVATISVGYLSGMCSDTSGNVWLIVWRPHSKGYYLDEYAHGGTKPIAQIRIPDGGFGNGCAVDPKSGDLAVMNPAGGAPYGGLIDVWAGARAGKPAVYDVPFVPENGAYDDHGNLFVDGRPGGSDPWLLFGVLAKGSGAVANLRLSKKTSFPGGVQWDGKYVAVQTGGYQPYLRGRPRIYRIRISGNVVGTVIPKDPALHGTAWFAVRNDSVVSMTGPHGDQIDVWPYPAGGSHTRVIGRFGNIRGLTISVSSAGG